MRLASAAFAFVTLFLYLYSLNFSALPLGVGSRVYLGLAGLAVLFLDFVFVRDKSRRLHPQFVSIMGCLFLMAFIAILSVLWNQSSDLELVKYAVSVLLITAAAYFLVRVFTRIYGAGASQKVLYFIVACVALQCLLAVVMFLNPALRDALLNLLSAADLESDLISSAGEIRLIGFGSTFFGAGITNGMALLLILYCFRHHAPARPARLALGGAYVLIAVVGMLMARTTALGLILSLLYLHLGGVVARGAAAGQRKPVPYYRNFVLAALATVAMLLVLVVLVIDIDVIMPVLDWAFEPVINYFSGNGLNSASTDQLMDMYGDADLWSLPFGIGDAKFLDPQDPAQYYQHVDIGYLRLIYYFGVPGMLAYLLFQLRAVACSAAFFSADKIFVAVLGLYLLLLNFKGFADIYPFSILFFLFAYLDARHLARPARPVLAFVES